MKLRFGAIITDGFGKIGGHTVRRFRGTRSMYMTTMPTKTLAFQTNSAQQTLRNVFSQWSQFSGATQRAWRERALEYPFPDKWGYDKFLSGREFFSKVAINCVFGGYDLPDPTVSFGQTPALEVTGVALNKTATYLKFDNLRVTEDWRVLVHVRRLKNSSVNPDPSRVKFCCWIESLGLTSAEVFDIVESNFGSFKVGAFYQFTLYGVSPFGLKSGLASFIVECS